MEYWSVKISVLICYIRDISVPSVLNTSKSYSITPLLQHSIIPKT